MIYSGSCHCQAVKFEIEAAAEVECERCNCSICEKAGFIHLIVPKANFRLLQGQEQLSTYTFNTGVAKHHFCKNCGVKAFYIPRSNPDGVDVNLRCLDTRPEIVSIVDFDGQHWEQHAHKLAHKSL
ncbi:GFA family protein [Alteromonadaceae bacterium BrNp21-10]|nr:GFA family protein [Alteromonadaceae bacterium BrNp21-10]